MSSPEPKLAHHHGRGIRSCPIFPELRSILDEAFEIFGSESEYVVAAPAPGGGEEGDGLTGCWCGKGARDGLHTRFIGTVQEHS